MKKIIQKLATLKKEGRFSKKFLIALFLLFPQMAAAVITGHSLSLLWREWKGEGEGFHANKKHLVKVVGVWALAYLWLIIFWGGVIFLFKKFLFN